MTKRTKEPVSTVTQLKDVRLADLKPHPDQEVYFPLCDEHAFEALVRSVSAKGVETPIDVLPVGNAAGLPGNTIIGGHSRAEASRRAGLTTIPARVRYDLLGAPRAEVDEIFLGDNTLRRQLSRLGQARAAVGIYLARQAQAGRRVRGSVFVDEALRDEVGKILGMSARNLGRYLNVLESPLEVQVALEQGRVTLIQASQVMGLLPEQREELAVRLRAGEDASAVFEQFFPPKIPEQTQPVDAIVAFVRSIEQAHARLADRLGEVPKRSVIRHTKTLRNGEKLIQAILAKFWKTK